MTFEERDQTDATGLQVAVACYRALVGTKAADRGTITIRRSSFFSPISLKGRQTHARISHRGDRRRPQAHERSFSLWKTRAGVMFW